MAFALTGARIFDGEAMADGQAVIIEGPRISVVCPVAEVPAGIERRALEGGLLAPGFIDVQVNGGGGALLNADANLEGGWRIAASHRKFGTTGLLLTVITDAPDVLDRAIAAVAAAQAGAVPGVLGIHIEGPFLDVVRKGAHEARFIRAMTCADAERIAGLDCGAVMVTLAPNKVAPELIAQLASAGVLVSLGHAEASYEEAMIAMRSGARAFTHIYNAMSQASVREPGMVGAALTDAQSFVGLIADGLHVHDGAMRLVMAARPVSRIMLVSDAMPSAAGGPGQFQLQGRTVRRANGRLELEDGTLAGSNITMDEAVRYCVSRLDVSLADALVMASLTPARFLRLDHQLGRIRPGHLASLVHLDNDLHVRATWIEGA